jgi:cell division protein FtsZ
LGALNVAVVTKPFSFEGPKRRKQAEQGLAELASVVDTVISIPNDQLLELVPKGTSFFEAFRVADDVLRQAVQGIADIITTPGLINRDFSDVRSIMNGMGYAMMGTASARGENAAMNAAEKAITCPLMEAGGVRGARGVLINITGSSRLTLHEVNEACTLIREACANDDVQINFGVVLNEAMGEEVKITVIATGFVRENLPAIERRPRAGYAVSSQIAATPAPVIPQMTLSPAEPAYEEPVDQEPMHAEVVAAEQVYVEPVNDAPMSMAASASAAPQTPPASPTNGPATEPLFNNLDVPAILRRDRRLVQ